MEDTDSIDRILEQWAERRPELDTAAFAVVGRVLILAKLLERRFNQALEPWGLALWAFDVLATLRRQGPPFSLTPTELSGATLLSSGAMTNRINRLEASGWVRRESDPADRRGVRVVLTPSGQALIDRAVEARFEESARAVRSLTGPDQETLAALLRGMLLDVNDT